MSSEPKTRADYVAEAVALFKAKLADHPDEGVRLLNEVADISQHMGVQRLADLLQQRDEREKL